MVNTSRQSNNDKLPQQSLSRTLVAILAIAALLLTGCASGDAGESRRFEAQEAEEGAVVPELQMTTVAREVMRPTARPGPTSTPAAQLGRLVLTASAADGAPTSEIQSASTSAGTIYTAALLSSVQDGQVVSARWIDQNDNLIAQSDSQFPAGASSAWLYFPLELNGSLPPGNYGVVISVDGNPLDSIAFRLF